MVNYADGDWSVALITPPASEPLTLTQAKLALRIDPDLDDDDDYITDCIVNARSYLESAYDLKIMPQTWEYRLQRFPRAMGIRFPFGPVQSILSFTYEDTGGNVFPLTCGAGGTGDTSFDLLTRLGKKPAEVVLPFGKVWPPVTLQTADPIRIQIRYGYLNGLSPETLPLPGQLLQALKLLLGHFNENRSAASIGALNLTKAIDLGVASLMSTLGFQRYD